MLCPAQFRMTSQEPCGNRAIELGKMAGKKVIRIIDHREMVLSGKRGNEFFHFNARPKFVLCTVDK